MAKLKTFKVPVVWQMMGYETVEAKSLTAAIDKVMSEEYAAVQGLPEGNYIDDSFGVDIEGLDGKVKAKDFPVGTFK